MTAAESVRLAGVSPKRERLVYLDVLRAAAILLVLGRHPPVPAPAGSAGGILFELWYRVGWVGVDLFFCLSGFLIGGLLFSEYRDRGEINVSRFYVRRGFKIWPSYLVWLAAVVAAALYARFRGAAGVDLRSLWPNLVHVQNYFGSPYPHTWSLSVEEHFYLALPALLLLLLRTRAGFRWLPVTFAVVAMACLAMRVLAVWLRQPIGFWTHVTPTHLRFDSLFVGVLLAYLLQVRGLGAGSIVRRRWAFLAAGIACFAPAVLFDAESPMLITVGFSILAFGSALITTWAWAMTFAGTPPFIARWLAAIGAFSYSIYLWHMPFAQRMALFLVRPIPEGPYRHATLMGVYVVAAMGIGVVLYLLIERPALVVRDRMFPPTAKRQGRDPRLP
jgi:peptidoglycan/LPS O-acetylase OafA/YrhL